MGKMTNKDWWLGRTPEQQERKAANNERYRGQIAAANEKRDAQLAEIDAARDALRTSRPPTAGPLASERVVVAAPMSFAGSLGRLRKLPAWAFWTVGLVLLLAWWTLILAWYVVFGLLLVPYRLVRRGSRKRKQDELRHREQLDALRQ